MLQNAALKDKLAHTGAKSETSLSEEELAQRAAKAEEIKRQHEEEAAKMAAENAALKNKLANTEAKSDMKLTAEEEAERERCVPSPPLLTLFTPSPPRTLLLPSFPSHGTLSPLRTPH